jgi:hypothetical protein
MVLLLQRQEHAVQEAYIIIRIPPGDYKIVKTDDPDYPVDISNDDASPEDDTDSDTNVDDTIAVTIPGEDDTDNNFVESNSQKLLLTKRANERDPYIGKARRKHCNNCD